jgi:hypothetical protein
VKRYNGPTNSYDDAKSLVIDESGNVFVTGASGNTGTGDDYATIKYDTNGNELWVKRYDGSASGDDRGYFIAVDTSENIYVTGLSMGIETGSDFATVKYVKTEEIEITMELPAGWEMISLPVNPDKATLNDLFPGAVVAYKFVKTKGYDRVLENENFEVGMGYWILLNTPTSYKIKGTAIPEYTIPIENGWAMIGGCSSSAQKNRKEREL